MPRGSTCAAGGPLDIDETAYMTLAFETTSSNHRIVTGPVVLWRSTGALAPLVPLTTAPLHYLFGRTIEVSHLVNLGWFALLVVSTYLLARHLTTAWWAVLAAAVVATAPGITDYVRHYHFAVASAATFTFALYAVIRSEHLSNRRWSLVFGASLGLVLLARTFMLAFAPALVLAAAVAAWSPPGQATGAAPTPRRPRLVNLALGLLVGALVAGSWYVFSASAVWTYLTDFGYGTQSDTYGPQSMRSLSYWLTDLVAVVRDGLYLPLAVVLAIGATAGVAGLWRSGHLRGWWRRLVRSDAAVLVVAIGVGFAALLSSRNTGTGFVLPLLPAAVVLSIALISRIRARMVWLAFAVLLGLISVANVATKANAVSAFDGDLAWSPTPWANLRIFDSDSIIDRYRARYDHGATGARDDGWIEAGRALYEQTQAHGPADDPDPEVLFLVEGAFVNSSTPLLASQMEQQQSFGARNVDVTDVGAVQTTPALTSYLREARADGIDEVVTGPAALSWPEQAIAQDVTEEASRRAGFRPVASVPLPDGGHVTLWAPPAG